jgi:cytochrome c oxidase cbb3-type subunit 3
MRALVAFAACLALAACEREARRIDKPPHAATVTADPMTPLHPGEAGPGPQMTHESGAYNDSNAFELSQGKRLYKWYNCNGCHGSGGGGMGPALMDDKWLYGSAPDQVFATIMEGRPNGMPSFKGRIPEDEAWQLVAYVRSMSALTPKNARPSRGDGMQAVISESRRHRGETRKQ